MKNIKDLLSSKKVITSGFKAIIELAEHSQGTDEVILSSLSPAVLAEQGVTEYYALQLPRGTVFKTAEEIIEANLPVCKYEIDTVFNTNGLDVVIVSRHQGTVDILKRQYPNANVLEQISTDDIAGNHVVGTLPPHLITAASAYTAVTIANFDYTKDSDLSGQELEERLIISDNPIKLTEVVYMAEEKEIYVPDPEDYDIVYNFFVEGAFEVVDKFAKELSIQLQQEYDFNEDDLPEWAMNEPYENIDGAKLVQQVAKNYNIKVHYSYDEKVSWETKGFALYILLGYLGRGDEDAVRIDCFEETYPQTFEDEAINEWEQYCEQLYRNYQHPFKEEWESEEIPFTDKIYAEKFPEWGKVLQKKS